MCLHLISILIVPRNVIETQHYMMIIRRSAYYYKYEYSVHTTTTLCVLIFLHIRTFDKYFYSVCRLLPIWNRSWRAWLCVTVERFNSRGEHGARRLFLADLLSSWMTDIDVSPRGAKLGTNSSDIDCCSRGLAVDEFLVFNQLFITYYITFIRTRGSTIWKTDLSNGLLRRVPVKLYKSVHKYQKDLL